MHRQPERLGQGHDDPAPGAAVQFGNDQTGDGNHLFEHFHLLHGVLPGGRVQHQQHRMRRGLILLPQHANDLRQFIHQRGLVVQPPGGVDQQHIRTRRRRLRQRIECQTRRVRVRLAGDHGRARPFAPDLQLLHRRRAERVARGHHRVLALFPVVLGQLADRRRLAGAIHPHHQHDVRLARRVQHQRQCHGLQDFRDFLGQGVLDLLVRHFLAEPAAAKRVDDLCRRGGA